MINCTKCGAMMADTPFHLCVKCDELNAFGYSENWAECCTCGQRWVRGQDGSHSCIEKLKETIAQLKEHLERIMSGHSFGPWTDEEREAMFGPKKEEHAETASKDRCNLGFPCLASIWKLSGLEESCEVCEPFMEDTRKLHNWEQIGDFWMSPSIAKTQREEILKRIAEIEGEGREG